MLVLHDLSDHPLLELSAAMCRWIAFLGLSQTAALSFILLMPTPRIKNSRTVLQERQHTRSWKDIGAAWKKQEGRDKHVMEDVFLDEGYAQNLDEGCHLDMGEFCPDEVVEDLSLDEGYAQDLDEDYHFGEGEFHFDEVEEALDEDESLDEDELNTRGPLAP